MITAGLIIYTPFGSIIAPPVVAILTNDMVLIEKMSGSLAGPFAAERVTIRDESYHLRFEHVSVDWNVYAWLSGKLDVNDLRVGNFQLAAQGSGQHEDPKQFFLPFPMSAKAISVQRLQWHSQLDLDDAGSLLFHDISAQFSSDGSIHRASAQGKRDHITVKTQLKLQGDETLVTSGEVSGHLTADEHLLSWTSTISGTLPRLQVNGNIQGLKSTGTIDATLTLFQAYWLEQLALDTEGIDLSNVFPSSPKTNLIIKANTRLTDTTAITGTVVVSNSMAGTLDTQRLPVDSVAAVIDANLSGFQLSELVLQRGSGILRGSASFENEQFIADLKIQNIDLREIYPEIKLGSVNGTVHTVIGSKQQSADLVLQKGQNRLSAFIENNAERINIPRFHIVEKSGSANATIQMEWNETKAFKVQASTDNLNLRNWLGLEDSLIKMQFNAEGALSPSWSVNLNYNISQSKIEGRPLSGEGRLSWQDLKQMNIEALLRIGNNQLKAHGALGKKDAQLNFDIDAPDLRLPFLKGSMVGKGYIGGEWSEPFGEFAITTPELQISDHVHIQNLVASTSFKLNKDAPVFIHVGADTFHIGDALRLDQLSFDLTGTRARHVAEFSAKDQKAQWKFKLTGGLQQGKWLGDVNQLTLHAIDTIALANSAALSIDSENVSFGPAQFQLSDGELYVDHFKKSGARVSSKGKLVRWPVAHLLPIEFTESDLRVGGSWDIQWNKQPSGNIELFKESGDIRWRHIKRQSLGLEEAYITAEFGKDAITAEMILRGDNIGLWSGNLRSPMREFISDVTNAPLEGNILINSPRLDWVGPLISPNFVSSGSMEGKLMLTGSMNKPQFIGELHGRQLGFVSIGTGMRLKDGMVDIGIDNHSLNLHHLEFADDGRQKPAHESLAHIGGGGIKGKGQIRWQKQEGEIELNFDRLGVMQLPQQWIRLSGVTTAIYRDGAATLKGELKADGGSLKLAERGRPSLSEDVIIDEQEKPRQQSRISVEMFADLGEQFYFSGSGVESRLAGKLTLTALPDNPLQANGTISTVDGQFDGYGQRLSIERGNLYFQGIIDDPGLDIRAMRKTAVVSAGVEVTGTVLNPVVKLVSVPNLPDAEKLSWLVLGKGLSDVKAGDPGILIAAGTALLGDNDATSALDLRRRFGIDIGFRTGNLDDRTIGPRSRTINDSVTDGTGSTDIVTVSKELISGVNVGFEQVVGTNESIVRLSIALSEALSLETRSGQDNSIDLFYTITLGK